MSGAVAFICHESISSCSMSATSSVTMRTLGLFCAVTKLTEEDCPVICLNASSASCLLSATFPFTPASAKPVTISLSPMTKYSTFQTLQNNDKQCHKESPETDAFCKTDEWKCFTRKLCVLTHGAHCSRTNFSNSHAACDTGKSYCKTRCDILYRLRIVSRL